MQIRITAENECRRYADHTHEEAVKEKCNDRFSSGPECEISRVQKRFKRSLHCHCDEKQRSQVPRFVIGIVQLRKQRRSQKHEQHDARPDEHGRCNDPCIRLLCLFHLPGAKKLSDYDRDCISHRDKCYVEHIVDGIGDVLPCYGIQTTKGICLALKKDAECPERLIDQKRSACHEKLLSRGKGDLQSPVDTPDIGVRTAVTVKPDHDDGALHHPGQIRCDSRAIDSKFRKSEFSVDQQIIEHQIHKDCSHARLHGHQRLAAFTQRTGIGDADEQDRHPQEYDMHIPQAVAKRCGKIAPALALIEEQADQITSEEMHDHKGERRDDQSHPQLEPEGVPNSIVILVSVILRSKDANS